MRISDWSSDVCSSDLVPGPTDESLFAQEPLPHPPSFDEEDVSDKPSFVQAQGSLSVAAVERDFRCGLASLRAVDRGIASLYQTLEGRDRKSVVEGKRWQVRVSLGGCRIIKKKK